MHRQIVIARDRRRVLEKFDRTVGGCLIVACPAQEFEGTQSGKRPELIDEMRLVVVAAGERHIRPPYRRLVAGANSTDVLTIEIRFSLHIR